MYVLLEGIGQGVSADGYSGALHSARAALQEFCFRIRYVKDEGTGQVLTWPRRDEDPT